MQSRGHIFGFRSSIFNSGFLHLWLWELLQQVGFPACSLLTSSSWLGLQWVGEPFSSACGLCPQPLTVLRGCCLGGRWPFPNSLLGQWPHVLPNLCKHLQSPSWHTESLCQMTLCLWTWWEVASKPHHWDILQHERDRRWSEQKHRGWSANV